jgi:hypothetical protein
VQDLQDHAGPAGRPGVPPGRDALLRGAEQGVDVGVWVADAEVETVRGPLAPDLAVRARLLQGERRAEIGVERRLPVGSRLGAFLPVRLEVLGVADQ